MERIIKYVHSLRKNPFTEQMGKILSNTVSNYMFEFNNEETRMCITADLKQSLPDMLIEDVTCAIDIDIGNMAFAFRNPVSADWIFLKIPKAA